MNFEEAYQRLSETAAALENGNLPLDKSLALYEEGVALAERCKELLDKAELRVKQISPGEPESETRQATLDLGEDDDFI
ncbi:exodeoxyribonuclease VII small subunit [Candidatus Chlorohelix allophototropha]|nr:exodeoxyribonuclease VII small subunit [Chloroflexota bacterium L227-S17]